MCDFYKNQLGLPFKLGEEDGPYCEFETGSTDIAIFERSAMEDALGMKLPKMELNTNLIIIFPVLNVDKEYQRLQDLGIEFIMEPITRDGWDVRTAQFKDPDGNIIEINTRVELLNAENSEGYFE
jgi:predicted enzyme related to lactoylglutathione lyase